MSRTTSLPKQLILAQYAGGKSVESLATTYKRSQTTMLENLHRWGASIRRRGPIRKYELNEEFFSNVQTEEQAYWLGFLLADGNVCKNRMFCRIDLAIKDKEHLIKLAKSVETNAPINIGHNGRSIYLTLSSAKLCNALIHLECFPAKTGKHGIPAIPIRLYKHLYRGFFDGDGSLYFVPSVRFWRFDVTGSSKFVIAFQDWLIANADVAKTKLFCGKCVADVSSIRYSGIPQIDRIMRALYEDATIYLDRKYTKYLELINRSLVRRPYGSCSNKAS